MKAIVVNPNCDELEEMQNIVQKVHADYEVIGFVDSMLAYKYAFNMKSIDSLYTVIEMSRLDGFSLARMMRADNPGLNINFCSYDKRFMKDAEKFGCDCFL